MGFLDRVFGKKSKTEGTASAGPAQPKFVSKEKKGESTYEVYKGTTAEAARTFLATKRVDKPVYYIVVETPEGNWGIDLKGIYLERLLPWQKDTGSAQCDGSLASFPDMFGLQMAAKGYNDNFIVQVKCGKCEHEWSDGVQYQKLTVVRCPSCRTLNKIDSSNIRVAFA